MLCGEGCWQESLTGIALKSQFLHIIADILVEHTTPCFVLILHFFRVLTPLREDQQVVVLLLEEVVLLKAPLQAVRQMNVTISSSSSYAFPCVSVGGVVSSFGEIV